MALELSLRRREARSDRARGTERTTDPQRNTDSHPTADPDRGSGAGGDEHGDVVSLESLDVRFDGRRRRAHALREVDLTIRAGERVALVGESGSGKSVLSLAVLGLLPPAQVSGRAIVRVDGDEVDMVGDPDDARRRFRQAHLGAVFQDPMTSLNPTMRVGRQVAEAAGSAQAAVEVLGRVGVPDPSRRARQYPHELSGGLRQRVMIAMAVAGDPSLVVADEPTTALDVTVQARITALLRELTEQRGLSLLFVTHDLGCAAEVAERIVVLYGGRVCEDGPAEQVLTDPLHPYTRALLAARVTLRTDRDRPLPTLPGEPPDPADLPPGCAFAPRCPHRVDACEDELPPLQPAPQLQPGPRLQPGTAADAPDAVRQVACIRVDEIDRHAVVSVVGEAPWPAASPPREPWDRLTATDVHRRFRLARRTHLHALRGVDLVVEAGESVALVGESGCGKSTLLRLAARLLRPSSGSVEISPGPRPQLVFQDAGASLTPWMTVGDLVRERCVVFGQSRQHAARRAEEVAALVGLPLDALDARAGQLSGGQRQRAALARAVAVPPNLLLCDEPISALDVSLAAVVLNLLGRLRRELGMSVLFVTHDLAAARVVADRIAVMHLGRIVEIAEADVLVNHPRHPYTQALLGSVPDPLGLGGPSSHGNPWSQEADATAGEPPSATEPPPGCSYVSTCPLVHERCHTEAPEARTLTMGSMVRCHAAVDELAALGGPAGGQEA